MAKKTRSVEVNGRQIRLRPERYSWSDFFMALPAVLLLVLGWRAVQNKEV